jgi:hypothetical protein
VSAVVTALGWVGAVTCLVAYVCVTRGRWSPTSGRYQAANVVSGLLMGLVAASSGVWPSVVTNAVWAVVGVHAVGVVLRARRRQAGEVAATGTTDEGAVGTPAPAVATGPAVVDLAA